MMSWVLAIFAAMLPLYVVRFDVPAFGIVLPTTLLELAFFVVVGVWICEELRMGGWKGLMTTLREWRWPIGLFVIASVIGVFLAQDIVGAVGLWRAYIFEPLVLFVIAKEVMKRDKERERVIAGLSVGLTIIGFIAVVQKITGYGIPAVWQPEGVRRVTAIFGFPNAVGLFCAPLVMIVMARGIASFTTFARNDILKALPYFGAAMVGVLACLFAKSTGALFGIAAGFMVLGLGFPKLRVVTLAAVILGCLLVMLWPELRGFVALAVSLRDDGGYIRAFIWSDTWQMLVAHPVLGVGFGNYPIGFASFRTRTWIEIFQYPHNILFNFWSEMGLMGVIGFGWIVGKVLKKCIIGLSKKENYVSVGVLAAMVTLLVHGLVDVPYFKNDLAMMFWLLVALVP
jgi:O-antigen ligase